MGVIKMGGSASMAFEPDYCRIEMTVSVRDGNSGNALKKGQQQTEKLLAMLRENVGIEPCNITLEKEFIREDYNRRNEINYEFCKTFYFCYPNDNRITESITALFGDIPAIKYDIDFGINGEAEKERLVMERAVQDSRQKAEMLAGALGTEITGFQEIKYDFREVEPMNDIAVAAFAGKARNLASEMKNRQKEISKSVSVIWTTK